MGLLGNIDKKASVKNPREMIIFSYPKVGKTEMMTKLPGNYLILDTEGGTDFYDCKGISVSNADTFQQIIKEMTETNAHFDYIVVDTLTSLLDGVINALCVRQYNKEEKKNKSDDWDITQLAYGAGHGMMRDKVKKVFDKLKKHCNTLIICAHVADKALDGKDENSTVKDLDVPGKMKSILSLKTDAIGLLHRTDKLENTITFINSSGMIGGTRAQHLANKSFVISEKEENGNLKTHWDKVFIK